MKQILPTNAKQLQVNKRRKYNGSPSLTKVNLLRFCFLRLSVAPTMLGVVGSVLEWCASGCNISQHCWDLQCIVGRIQPTRRCKPCVMSVRGRNNVGRAVQTDPTLLRYASAITEQKKCGSCWPTSLTGFKLCATTCNRVCKRTQHVTSNNVGSCWSTITGQNNLFRSSLSNIK